MGICGGAAKPAPHHRHEGHEHRGDGPPQGGLGVEEHPREVDRAARLVLGLELVALDRRGEGVRLHLVANLLGHHVQQRHRRQHHDERDAALHLSPTLPRARRDARRRRRFGAAEGSSPGDGEGMLSALSRSAARR
jgi:hypothetical protein